MWYWPKTCSHKFYVISCLRVKILLYVIERSIIYASLINIWISVRKVHANCSPWWNPIPNHWKPKKACSIHMLCISIIQGIICRRCRQNIVVWKPHGSIDLDNVSSSLFNLKKRVHGWSACVWGSHKDNSDCSRGTKSVGACLGSDPNPVLDAITFCIAIRTKRASLARLKICKASRRLILEIRVMPSPEMIAILCTLRYKLVLTYNYLVQ